MLPGDPLGNPFVATLFWSAATILLYLAAKRVYRRFPLWWLTPLAVTPLLLMALVIGLDENYRVYFSATHWLVALLGPATVAFAIPIYQQCATIRRYWPVLLAGVLVGSSAAMASAWGLAHLLGLNEAISLSLMPRSMSTPFAMTVSGDIGGRPDLTAIFVVLTGIFGAALGEIMLHWLPVARHWRAVRFSVWARMAQALPERTRSAVRKAPSRGSSWCWSALSTCLPHR